MIHEYHNRAKIHYNGMALVDMQRLILAGTGFMAEMHASNLAQMDGVSIVAVVSPSGPGPFIDKFGLVATAYTDLTAAIKDSNVDAVVICTPTHTHRECIETALTREVAVFCEKPLAPSLTEAAAIRDTAEDANVPIMVGHVVRYFPEYTGAKREVDSGAVGEVGVARAHRHSPFPEWGSANWFAEPEKSGGIFVDMAIHDLDYLRWVCGDVERVFARVTGDGTAQHGTVTLRFESGAMGYVEASWAYPDSKELSTELEFAGDEGVVQVNSDDITPYHTFTDEGETVENPLVENGYYRELAHFFDCIESGNSPDISIEGAIAALRLSVAAQRSARKGMPIIPAEVTE